MYFLFAGILRMNILFVLAYTIYHKIQKKKTDLYIFCEIFSENKAGSILRACRCILIQFYYLCIIRLMSVNVFNSHHVRNIISLIQWLNLLLLSYERIHFPGLMFPSDSHPYSYLDVCHPSVSCIQYSRKSDKMECLCG